MSPVAAEDWSRIRALFRVASRLDPDQRLPFLQQACPGEPYLVEEVLALTAHADARDHPLHEAIVRTARELAGRQRRR